MITYIVTLRLFVASLAVPLCLVSAAMADQSAVPSSFELEYVGSTMWGSTNDIIKYGDFLYCAMVNGVAVFDVANPTNPVLVKQYYENRTAFCLDAKDNLLCVGYHEGFMQIFRIGSDGLLTSVTDFHVSLDSIRLSSVYNVLIDDGLVYLGTTNGLCIVDISDAQSPRVLGTYVPEGFYPEVWGLALVGDTLYLGGAVCAVDVSDPSHPVGLPVYVFAERTCDIIARGHYLYVADRSALQPSSDSRVLILSTETPDTVIQVGRYDIVGYLNDIELVGSYLYCATEYSGVVVLDVTDPTAPTLAGCFFPPLGEVTSICLVDDNTMFAANQPNIGFAQMPVNVCDASGEAITTAPPEGFVGGDMVVLDITDRVAPSAVGRYPFCTAPTSIAIEGSLAYVASQWGRMAVVDISTLPDMQVLSATASSPTACAPVLMDSLLLIAGLDRTVQVFNVAAPSDPVLLGQCHIERIPLSAAAVTHFAYVALGTAGVGVIDVSDPTNPVICTMLATPGEADDLVAARGFVLVADNNAGLQVIDVSDPSSPFISNSRSGFASNVAFDNGRVYVCGTDSTEILHFAEDGSLEWLGSAPRVSYYDLAVAGNYLLLAEIDGGLVLADVSRPDSAFLVSDYDTRGAVFGVASHDDLVLVPDVTSLIALRLPHLTDVDDPAQDNIRLPQQLRLLQNHPNPFNSTTVIEYELEHTGVTRLTIYNTLGQIVRTLVDRKETAGHHAMAWNGRDAGGQTVASGVYYFQLSLDAVQQTRKMILLK